MLKKVLLSTALILSACSSIEDMPLPITSKSEKAIEFYEKGRYLQEQGEDYEASQNYEAALRIDADFVLANLNVQVEDPVQRRKYRDVAVSNKENVSDAEKLQVEIWMAYRDQENDKVIGLAKELTKKYPNSSESHIVLGDAYINQYMFEEGMASFEKAIEINPNSFRGYYGLVARHVVLGGPIMLPKEQRDEVKAKKYSEELIRIRPNSPVVYQIRANIERNASNFEEANKLYQKMIDVCNENGSLLKTTALLISGHNLMFSGDTEKAMNNYNEGIAIAATPQRQHNITFYKVYAHLLDNNYYEALNTLDGMLEIADQTSTSKERVIGNKAVIYWNKMMVHAHNQEKEKAFESLDKMIEYSEMNVDKDNNRQVRGFNGNKYRFSAWINALFGNYQKAKDQLKEHLKYVDKEKDGPTAMNNYYAISGMVSLMEGDPEKAVQSFENRNQQAEGEIYYNYFYGLALKAVGRTDEANEVFRFISNFNFLGWTTGVVRNMAQKALDS
tara:strand:+ start:227 stop:1735 length:1509 start_codon:yes stop_codon:yes gene_type:complete